MNDGTGRAPRLVVGISRSPASWWALAWAVGRPADAGRACCWSMFSARRGRSPRRGRLPGHAPHVPGPVRRPRGVRYALIRTAIDQAVGRMPGDVATEQQAFSGRPAVEFASIARGGDLLVLGSRCRGRLRLLAPGSVARACARRADCPVVIVPEPSPSVLQTSLPVGSARVSRFRWVPRRGARTASVTISRAGPGTRIVRDAARARSAGQRVLALAAAAPCADPHVMPSIARLPAASWRCCSGCRRIAAPLPESVLRAGDLCPASVS